MPYVQANGARLFYEETGNGPETIVFAHGLLWSHKMFRAQVQHLQKKFRIIAYDHRGQGQSQVQAPFDMDTLFEDAAALIGALCEDPVHFVGLSMGGFVGMRLGSRRPELIKTLVLLETSANAEPVENLPKYKMLNGIVKWVGVIGPIANQVMPIMFGDSWLANPNNAGEIDFWKGELKSNRRTITGPVEGVIYRKGLEAELHKITCPTMVVVGDEDTATKPEKAKFIQMSIRDAVLHLIPGAGHSSCIEKPQEVNRLLEEWFSSKD